MIYGIKVSEVDIRELIWNKKLLWDILFSNQKSGASGVLSNWDHYFYIRM